MCQFASWIEYDGEVLFLTADHLRDAKGRELAERIGGDINGHGAIREYYDLAPGVGVERECTDFGDPGNFPPAVVEAIKGGKMRGFGLPWGLLTEAARDEYDKINQSAWDEYLKIKQAASVDCKKIKQAAWVDYKKNKQAGWDEYLKIEQAGWDEYLKIGQAALWGLFSIEENRAESWREADCGCGVSKNKDGTCPSCDADRPDYREDR